MGVIEKILKLVSLKIKNQVRFTFLENEYAKQNSQLVASVAQQNDNTEAGFRIDVPIDSLKPSDWSRTKSNRRLFENLSKNINKWNREMTKLKSETLRYDQLDGESGNLLDDLKAWVENLHVVRVRWAINFLRGLIFLTGEVEKIEPIKVFQKESQKLRRKFPG